MEKFIELHAHYPKKLHIPMIIMKLVLFVSYFCGEGVTKRLKRGDVEATVRKVK